MSKLRRLVAGGFVLFGMAGAVIAEEATPPKPPAQAVAGETLKERLSDKASDQQRVDNCHVPPDRRGPEKRPDQCPPQRPDAPGG